MCYQLAARIALFFCPFLACSSSTLYSVSEIGTLGGLIQGYAINNRGDVTGVAGTEPINAFHAFLYSNGRLQDLGSLGVPDQRNELSSIGNAINDSSQVVGRTHSPLEGDHAFLYSNGTVWDLGSLGGGDSGATGINNAGQVTGSSNTPDHTYYAFLYSDGAMRRTGPLGYADTSGEDINNLGQIVGVADNTIGRAQTFIDTSGLVQWIGSLGGGQTWGAAINDSGQVTGSSLPPFGPAHAFLYADGYMTDIAPQWSYSFGTAINNLGEIVGNYVAGNSSRPFLYTHGTSTDLLDLVDPRFGLTSGYARGVNDAGQILFDSNDSTNRTFILTPVPEPAAVRLLLVGLFVLATLRAVTAHRSST